MKKRLASALCGFIALPALSFLPRCGGGSPPLDCRIEMSRPYLLAGTRGAWAPVNMGGRALDTWWVLCRRHLTTIKTDPRVPNGPTLVGVTVNLRNCMYDAPWVNLGNETVWRRATLVVVGTS